MIVHTPTINRLQQHVEPELWWVLKARRTPHLMLATVSTDSTNCNIILLVKGIPAGADCADALTKLTGH
jgi:CBS domain containing-hemolysin-like protein